MPVPPIPITSRRVVRGTGRIMCKERFRHESNDRLWNPATAIALAVPAEADVDMDIADQLHGHGSRASHDTAVLGTMVCERRYERWDFNAERPNSFRQPAARHDAGAPEPGQRSSDNTKCGNRFHGLQDDSMEDR
jgi:hypothetical protein